MKKLSSINILGQKVSIKYAEIEEWGLCDLDKKEITLSLECLKNKKDHKETLQHEVIHMILQMSGVAFLENSQEECLVRCIENLIIPWAIKNQ